MVREHSILSNGMYCTSRSQETTSYSIVPMIRLLTVILPTESRGPQDSLSLLPDNPHRSRALLCPSPVRDRQWCSLSVIPHNVRVFASAREWRCMWTL